MAATLLYLVRHAQPAPGEDSDDPALSELGMRQATALGGRLRRVPVTELLHGPASRTTGTAERVAAVLPGIAPQVCHHLRDLTPMPLPEHESSLSERHLAWSSTVPKDEQDLAGAALDAAVEHFAVVRSHDRHVVLVTHTFVIGWFVRRALDLPWHGWTGLQPFPGALTVIAVRNTAPMALVAYNDSGHLTGGLRTGEFLPLDL